MKLLMRLLLLVLFWGVVGLEGCGGGDTGKVVTPVTVKDELHLVSAQGEMIHLDINAGITEVIRVRSFSPDLSYVEGTDYRVNKPLGEIEILTGGGIAPGTVIDVDYSLNL